MYDRLIFPQIQKSKKHILLLGPRQVGKSTLTRQLKPDWILNLADESLFLQYSKDPSLLKREVLAIKKASLIVIDEVQRIPSLLNTLQYLMDENLGHRFILTGSSARKLKHGGANLLPGRIVLEHLYPLSIWELGEDFNLEKALIQGTLPGVYSDEEEAEQVLSTYTSVYLREEIQAESYLRNLGQYMRFLDLAAETNGDWINYSKLASDSEIPKETLRRFFQMLEDTLLIYRVNGFKPKNTKRRVSQRDRFILFDLGVRNALLDLHRSKMSPLEMGKLFETWVGLQLKFWIETQHKAWKLFSYRTEKGAEVDWVIETPQQLLAIECKWGKQIHESQMKGLRSLEEISHKAIQKFLVFTGEREQRFSKNERAIPYSDFFLKILPEYT